MKYKNMIVTGSMSWDLIMDFGGKFCDHVHPEMIHSLNLNFVVKDLARNMGGTATNIAYGVAEAMKICQISNISPKGRSASGRKYQTNKTFIKILGGLGKDGQDHLAFFKGHNINVRGILIDKKRYSASGSVITDMKNNQIWGFYYGACELGKNVAFKKFCSRRDVMVISANHPDAFLHTQRYAILNNIDYMYDVGMALGWIKDADLLRGIQRAKWLIGNDFEIDMILKRLKVTVGDIVNWGVDVISTLGEKGVQYESKSESYKVKSYKVHMVIDPTGAGDAWRGGFLAAYNNGLSIEECLRVGNVVASFAVETYGTVTYKVSKKEFNSRVLSLRGARSGI